MTSFGVTLLSGGLDSTTVTTYAKTLVDNLTAITFHYGQTHSKEVERAVEISDLLEVKHKLLDISFIGEVAWYSALTNPESFPIPKDRGIKKIGFGVPITYVPLRNTIFLSLSAAFLESQILHSIEYEGLPIEDVQATLFMAPNAIDYSGYPDCRPEFFEQMGETLRFGSKLGTAYRVPIKIETPIIDMSKAEIVKMGIELNAPLGRTWSCYEAGEKPCQSCDSCRLRAKGFNDAGIRDPIYVQN